MTLESLWEEHHGHIRSFVLSKINQTADAEDIVQNIFMKAHEGIGQLKDDEKAKAWLFQIARNSIIDHYRKSNRTVMLTEHEELPEEELKEDYTMKAAEGMLSVMKKLPDKYRVAVELTELKGLSQKELSERLNLSYSGAKSRVQRGREIVKAMMKSCCEIEADRYGNIVNYEVVLDKPVLKNNPNASMIIFTCFPNSI
ncbi:RNA polymerase sigma factor SigZ [Paenibacillus lupini]|uniref:RNA polymerase sigma factor SigZ n=1 Tax=Paenibacillus lupini TaxID=1450204 RepID=UPI001420E3FD|nr:RNA polymerase sigma factor SigZ [Paenibacillus lupini]NIK24625.1 RNA polymerase sigma-70 factor (ECF subfamily) [Paenibacillus lupini]